MSDNLPTLDEFRSTMLARGYDEVLERHWDPGVVVDRHSHPFEANALVIRGEMWLAIDGGPDRHLARGDRFNVERGVPHTERYGSDGASFWVARRN